MMFGEDRGRRGLVASAVTGGGGGLAIYITTCGRGLSERGVEASARLLAPHIDAEGVTNLFGKQDNIDQC